MGCSISSFGGTEVEQPCDQLLNHGHSATSGMPIPQKQDVTYWEKNEGGKLEDPLRHVQLIKVTSLIKLCDRQHVQRVSGQPITPMPRCQDWPTFDPEAIASPAELRGWSKEHRMTEGTTHLVHEITGLPIIVLSICWLDPHHPDRLGEQLQLLMPILRIFGAAGPFAVLWDYCSLPQKKGPLEDDRSPEMRERFKAALKTINQWYVHRLTTVILVTTLPNDLRPYSNPRAYDQRGWTTTERALASIVKSSSCLLDTKHVATLGMSGTLADLVAKRHAPIAPEAFAKLLADGVRDSRIKFTSASDLVIVSDQYEAGFSSGLSSMKGVYYAGLGWNDSDTHNLCESFVRCPPTNLERLRMNNNNLTDRSADLIVDVLANGLIPKLKSLKLECNYLSKKGIDKLERICHAHSVQLRVDGQHADGLDLQPPTRQEEATPDSPEPSRGSQQNKFVVAAGPLQGVYDAVYIATDLEPDDVVAIKALAPRLRKLPLLCCVGEHSLDKRSMMYDVLAHSGIAQKVKIVNGRRSQKLYPAGVEVAFRQRAEGHQVPQKEMDTSQECAKQIEEFLLRFNSPLAILLKPMHELRDISKIALEKTAVICYGSFNFTTTMNAQIEDEKAAGRALDHPGAFLQLMGRYEHSKACIIVERALSVGRVESLNQRSPIWQSIRSDSKLMQLIRGWQNVTLHDISADGLPSLCRSLSDEVSKLSSQVASTHQSSGQSYPLDEVSVSSAEGDSAVYDKLIQLAMRAQKKLGVLTDVCEHQGLQLPLADPLVAAVLLDDQGTLVPFLRGGTATMDAAGKVTMELNKDSNLKWLTVDSEKGESLKQEQRALLVSKVHEILSIALD